MAIDFVQPGERIWGDLRNNVTFPIMMSCWIYLDSTQNATNSNGRVVSISNSGFSDFISITYDSVPTTELKLVVNGTSNINLTLITSPSNDTWIHVLVYCDGTNARAWTNGTNQVDTAHGAGTFTTLDKWSLGSRYNSATQEVDCRVERCYWWNGLPTVTKATGDEIASHINEGGSPRLWYPEDIDTVVLGTYDKDELHGQAITETGTPDLLSIVNNQQGAW